jgi:hypothetical protein
MYLTCLIHNVPDVFVSLLELILVYSSPLLLHRAKVLLTVPHPSVVSRVLHGTANYRYQLIQVFRQQCLLSRRIQPEPCIRTHCRSHEIINEFAKQISLQVLIEVIEIE